MNVIKYEADDDVASNTNTIVIQNSKTQQVYKNYVHIKEEPELIIKSEFSWVPTNLEDEQQEYQQYQDTNESDWKNVFNSIKTDTMDYEEHAKEYLDNERENDKYNSSNDMEDDIEDDNCKSEENAIEPLNNEWESDEYNSSNDMDDIEDDHNKNYSVDIDGNSNKESTQNQNLFEEQAMDANGQSGSSIQFFNKARFIRWISYQYIKYICPICNTIVKHMYMFYAHFSREHKDLIDKTTALHFIPTSFKAACKICEKDVLKGTALLLHYLRHTMPDNLNFYECKICHIKSQICGYIKKHINEQHPEVKETYMSLKKKSLNSTYECSSCPAIYRSPDGLRYHFIDKHPIEYWDMYTFPCHLCQNSTNIFDDILEFYKHLIKEHNLNDLKLLNIKISTKFSDKQHFICTKCFKTFTEMDMKKFLGHYLEHSNYSWSCRICSKEISFQRKYVYHMCGEMFKKYRALAEENRENVRNTLTNWQEFEDYMKHVCSFCNREFETLKNWQLHLRRTHHIDTLKGLEMKKIPNDSTKLECNTCNTFVLNKSVELHIHRFQHLPYKPYKCRHCGRTLNNYKTALHHVLKKCKDLNKEIQAKTIRDYYEVVCPLCTNLKFANKAAILKHYHIEHNNFQNYFTKTQENTMLCNICELKLADNDNLCLNHILRHFDQKANKCLECFQSFNSRGVCGKHVNLHLIKPITKQQQRDTLNPSLRPTNDQKLVTNNSQIAKTVLERSSVLSEFVEFINYACPRCNECLATHQLWQDHIEEKHDIFQDENVCVKDPLDGSLKCKHCQLKSSNKIMDRQKHILTHMPYKSFICNICYHRSNSLGVLYGHLRRVHLARGTHKCPICPDVLSTQLEKMQHLKKSHSSSEWPGTMCTECYKTFKTKRGYKDHMITHDKNRKKFQCKYCDAKYVDKKDLRFHEASRHKNNIVDDGDGVTKKDLGSDASCTRTLK